FNVICALELKIQISDIMMENLYCSFLFIFLTCCQQ
ncbi:MAG: hypothetical protein ACJAZK_002354, partial [Psychroserpens sp.]